MKDTDIKVETYSNAAGVQSVTVTHMPTGTLVKEVGHNLPRHKTIQELKKLLEESINEQ